MSPSRGGGHRFLAWDGFASALLGTLCTWNSQIEVYGGVSMIWTYSTPTCSGSVARSGNVPSMSVKTFDSGCES